MQKLFLLSAFSFPLLLWGCGFNPPTQVDIDVDAMIESGVETLSGVWNTTKEAGQEYYNDQIKPTVDTAIVQAKEEADALRQEAKNQYNSGLEQINQEIDERAQNHADQAKNQVNKLKIE